MTRKKRDQANIVIRQVQPDHNDWPWSTIMNLFNLEPENNPGKEPIIETFFKIGIAGPSDFGLVNAFVNPAYIVTADCAGRGFYRASKRAQRTWFRQVKKILGTSGAVKRNTKKMTPIIRQLSYTGVMIVDGRHVLPNQCLNGKRGGGTA